MIDFKKPVQERPSQPSIGLGATEPDRGAIGNLKTDLLCGAAGGVALSLLYGTSPTTSLLAGGAVVVARQLRRVR